VTGTYHEVVALTTDRVTLDGEGTAILDGGAKMSSGWTAPTM